MSGQMGKLCSLILEEHFGDIVQKVGMDLMKWGPKHLSLICATTDLPLDKVKQALCVLVKYNIVTFEEGKGPVGIPDYQIHTERIVLLLRYPRYLYTVKSLYGDEAEMLLEELLRQGQDTASRIIVKAAKRLNETLEAGNKSVSVITLRDKFHQLITNQFIQRCPYPVLNESDSLVEDPKIPILKIKPEELYMTPDLDLSSLTACIQKRIEDPGQQPDGRVYWRANYDRFHQEFRDEVMVLAMTRRIDAHTGDLMRVLLHLMYARTDAWVSVSNPIPLSEIREAVRKKGELSVLLQYLDQYMKILEDDSVYFLQRVGDSGGGQYAVDVKNAFYELSWTTLENIVVEKFGSKAARIFRLIKMKKHIEQEKIQELGMIPAKEAKLLTYNLLQENFLQLQELKKSTSNLGPTKTFFLFHIDLNEVVSMVLEMCYKAMYNAITRREFEKTENKRLIEKQQRIDTIILNMKEQGATEDQLAEIEDMLTPPERTLLDKVRAMTDKLSQAELQLDETVFILQMFLYYQHQK